MGKESNYIEEFMKNNKISIVPIVCVKINTVYTHHRRLVIGEKYYTNKYVEGNDNRCNVYSDEDCKEFIGSYWSWMFLCIPLHRQKQIDSIFTD